LLSNFFLIAGIICIVLSLAFAWKAEQCRGAARVAVWSRDVGEHGSLSGWLLGTFGVVVYFSIAVLLAVASVYLWSLAAPLTKPTAASAESPEVQSATHDTSGKQ
jgi:hypothetical protein